MKARVPSQHPWLQNITYDLQNEIRGMDGIPGGMLSDQRSSLSPSRFVARLCLALAVASGGWRRWVNKT